jgi:hypothetical protein
METEGHSKQIQSSHWDPISSRCILIFSHSCLDLSGDLMFSESFLAIDLKIEPDQEKLASHFQNRIPLFCRLVNRRCLCNE